MNIGWTSPFRSEKVYRLSGLDLNTSIKAETPIEITGKSIITVGSYHILTKKM